MKKTIQINAVSKNTQKIMNEFCGVGIVLAWSPVTKKFYNVIPDDVAFHQNKSLFAFEFLNKETIEEAMAEAAKCFWSLKISEGYERLSVDVVDYFDSGIEPIEDRIITEDIPTSQDQIDSLSRTGKYSGRIEFKDGSILEFKSVTFETFKTVYIGVMLTGKEMGTILRSSYSPF